MDIIGYFMGKLGKKDEKVSENETNLSLDPLENGEEKAYSFVAFYVKGRYRFFYKFDTRKEYVCAVFENQKKEVLSYVEEQIALDKDKEEIKKVCRKMFSRKRKVKTAKKPIRKEYSFRKTSDEGRVSFQYRFGKNLEKVCRCSDDKDTRVWIVEDCRNYLQEGYNKEECIDMLRAKYQRPYPRKIKKNNRVLTWSGDGELLYYGNPTRISPHQLNMICTLHSNHSNPFTFADYVMQNLPNASVIAISYICTNYSNILFDELVSEGMHLLNQERGF